MESNQISSFSFLFFYFCEVPVLFKLSLLQKKCH